MSDLLRPILELAVVFPAAVLCLLPMKGHLRKHAKRILTAVGPLVLLWVVLGGILCYKNQWETNVMMPWLLLFALAYVRMVDLPVRKSIGVFLGVCGVFSCLTNLATGADAILAPHNHTPWFTLEGTLIFHLISWGFVLLVWYPSTHAVRAFLFETEIPVTWHVFWILPLFFIWLNILILPLDYSTLYAGRLLYLYPLVVGSILGLLLLCYLMFFLTAREMGKNMRLHQQNQFLQMQRAQYETLQSAIAETRQARHDLRHHFTAIGALVAKGAWEELRIYVENAEAHIPNGELNLCDNPATDGVAGHYAVQFRREKILFDCLLDLPRELPVAEMDVCVVLANLLENALEASRNVPEPRVSVRGTVHGKGLLLLQVENVFSGTIVEENGGFRSSKRQGLGIGLQSVRRIAEKNGGYCDFTYEGGLFCAHVMLRGNVGETGT